MQHSPLERQLQQDRLSVRCTHTPQPPFLHSHINPKVAHYTSSHHPHEYHTHHTQADITLAGDGESPWAPTSAQLHSHDPDGPLGLSFQQDSKAAPPLMQPIRVSLTAQ